jgi:hypothetical protein
MCLRTCHIANVCWDRFGENYVPEPKTAAAASTSHGTDPNWYLDSGATCHITGELDKLTMHEYYHGNDQVKTADDASMHINRIGNSIISTARGPLHLTNVLHVPRAHKYLDSVHRFNIDNHTFIELHSYFFIIKDQVTKKVLLRRPCKGGLYPLPSSLPPSLQKFASIAIKLSPDRWHNRLGHPSHDIVHRVLWDNNLLCSTTMNKESICDACLQAKGRQLPYPISSSHSSVPLDLVFSHVWDPTINSFGSMKYYVILLMFLVNSLGSICFAINMKFFNISMSSNNLLNTCSIRK